MFFDKIIGIRKVLMGLCMIGIGITLDSTHETLLIGIYGFFCVGNIVEHLCRVLTQRQTTPTDLSSLDLPLRKILDYQDTQIKALEFVVGFIKDSQRARSTS